MNIKVISKKLSIWSKILKKVMKHIKKRIIHQLTLQTYTLLQLEERHGMVWCRMEGIMILNVEVIISLIFILPKWLMIHQPSNYIILKKPNKKTLVNQRKSHQLTHLIFTHHLLGVKDGKACSQMVGTTILKSAEIIISNQLNNNSFN